MRNFLIAAVALAATPAAAAPPKLLIAISVDQFSADLFDQYRPHFTAGLARLVGGAVYRNGFQGHAATETCPGHSTILTGARPARTGIIANEWVDQSIARDDKRVYCAEDARTPGSTFRNYTVSPVLLRVPTLGERLKLANPQSRSVAVAGKDRAAIMMGGKAIDQRWYWTGRGYATDLKGAAVPAALTAVNAAVTQIIAQPAPALEPPPLCSAKAKSYAPEGGKVAVGAGAFARAAGDATGFRASPQFDGATLALAAGLIGEMKLGQGPATDLIAIGASATDYVGHTFGTEGQEMCLQLLSLDRDLGDFFKLLDSRGLDYAVVLTADHGGNDLPERERDSGIAGAGRVARALYPSEVSRTVAAKLGISAPTLRGDLPFGDIYLDRSVSAADRPRVLAEALAVYRAHPQVEAAFTRDEILRTAIPTRAPNAWSLIERVRASFDAERSGDFIVLLKPRVTLPVTGPYVTTHGSPWDYDRRVPILFWRTGMAASGSDVAVETVDIAPTLAAWIGLPLAPDAVDGKCLAVAGVTCPAR